MNKKSWSRAATTARWLIPLAILFVIFRAVDWEKLTSALALANSWLIVAGISCYPLVILLGAARWHTMLRAYHGQRAHYAVSLKDYWSGLAVGVFAPASLGWDVFRVAVTTRRYGNVIGNAATIVAEKIAALLTCLTLVIVLIPFVNISTDNEVVQQAMGIVHIILVGALVFSTTAFFIARHRATSNFLQSIARRLAQRLDQLSRRTEGSGSRETSVAATIAPLRHPEIFLLATVFSILIQVTTAVANQILFISVNHDLPFLVNMFVVPVLYFVFLLPISFGSLGIREGAYILLYGVFSVPMESALLVSLFNLFSILLNNLIGSIILALNRSPLPHTQSSQ